MSAPEAAAGGAPKPPAELLVERLPLLEQHIGDLVAHAGEGRWQLVPGGNGAIGTAYGRSIIDGMSALVVVTKWHGLKNIPTDMAKYGMQVFDDSLRVSWFTGTTTAEEVQFDHAKKPKTLPPNYPKAVDLSRLVLSAEPIELPAPITARTVAALLRKTLWEGMKLWGESEGGGRGHNNWPYHP